MTNSLMRHSPSSLYKSWIAAAGMIVTLSSAVDVHYLGAQSPSSGADSSIFTRFTQAPAPSSLRLANGEPGPKYWQNRADYSLRARLDTASGSVQGSMTLVYRNNSPNTLDVIWLQAEQNQFKKRGPSFGNNIVGFSQIVGKESVPLKYEEDGTVTKVSLSAPLKPGASVTIQAEWTFVVPRGGGRMGRDGSAYQIAQWFPRVAVYDDVKGWNLDQYTGPGEFYTDYGDINLEVTVPSNYIVAATGALVNPADVLPAAQVARLAEAAKSDTVIRIITADELTSGAARPTTEGMLTWKFVSKNVRDAVWCTAPNYQWDAANWTGILAQAFYRPRAAGTWSQAADMTKFSIQHYSEKWDFKYPYPHMTAVEGVEAGMEYPMLTMVAAYPAVPQLFNVISHEIGHIWFPMIVGSNERVHPWMDEGINQFINTFADAERHPEGGAQAQRAGQYVRGMEQIMSRSQDLVMDVHTDQMRNLGFQAYFKPAGIMEILRRDVLGPDTFDIALKTYLKRWAYKHPTPVDFFRTMEDVSKQDLSWFWRQFFYEAPRFDQGIASVEPTGDGATVKYENRARGVLPLNVVITFSDNSTEQFAYPATVWKDSNEFAVPYKFSGKTISSVVIKPAIDANRSNNMWAPAAPAATP